MSFDFRGTFNKSQFDRFKAWAEAQTADIPGRINHLVSEQQRIGVVNFAFDSNGIPTSYSVDPPTSQLARLFQVYEILGGDPFFDLNLRTKNQPVYLLKADETVPAQLMSNGEIMAQGALADRGSQELMAKARGWLKDTLAYRRESIEHEIRRLVDYQEQLQTEADDLARVAAGEEVENSLAFLFVALQDLMTDPTYRAAYDDKGEDPHGKLTSAPMLPYSGGPDRAPGDVYGKDAGDTGVVKPGQQVG